MDTASDRRMLEFDQKTALLQMQIVREILVAERRHRSYPGPLQDFGRFPAIAPRGPMRNDHVQFIFVLLARRAVRKRGSAASAG